MTKRTVLLAFCSAALWLGGANPAAAVEPAPLTELRGCSLIPTDWADGDSFRVRDADGNEFTLRLYGADCLEWHVTDDTDARRLRRQRRYFGISEAGGSPQASIRLAKDFGEKAAKRVAELLKKPFTVHTTFADARGDGRHKRIYGFVTTPDGRDLASVLVAEGLARAFGVYRTPPDGASRDEYRAHLKDLELQAAMRRVGAWSKTDWEKLPLERRLQRKDDAELGLALGKAPPDRKINPNTAARDELMRLPGIGETTANRIIEGRPYRTPEDLTRVRGIGEKTLEKLSPYLEFQSKPGH